MMTELPVTVLEFRRIAASKLSFLVKYGFKRMESEENVSSMGSAIVYLGKSVGFVFSYDAKDEQVDARVVEVCDGKITSDMLGGYSSGLDTYLVKHGFRGRSSASFRGLSPQRTIGNMIDVWVDVLKNGGRMLLLDQPNSLQ
jgi:hypothetical protein